MISSRAFLVPALLLLVFAPALSCGGSAIESDRDVSSAADLIVQSNGRLKPLATHARETMQMILGEADRSGLDALDAYFCLLLDMETWVKKAFLPCGEELAGKAFDGRTLLSPMDMWEARDRWGEIKSKEATELSVRFSMLSHLSFNFRCLPGLPVKHGPHVTETQEWHHPESAAQLAGEDRAWIDEGVAAWSDLKEAYDGRDDAAFAAAVSALKEAQRHAPGVVLSDGAAAFENFYYSVDTLFVGLVLFSIATLLFIVSAFWRRPAMSRLALLVLIAGILWNCWIIGGRTAIGHRLPLRNTNEVYLVVLFCLPLIGVLMQGLLRNALYSAISAGLCVVGYSMGIYKLEPEGYDIEPLVAILISPWREVHILTIMLSYAILLVALGLHLAYLAVRLYRHFREKRPGDMSTIRMIESDLNRKAYLTVAWGFLFLTTGIATGAAWAHSSWGRYWGWDCKEVWATVAWTIYAGFLHVRIFFRVPGWAMALINIVGYGAILFTYFGVKYILAEGLHAY